MSAIRPYRCVAIIARVREVIRPAKAAGSIDIDSGSHVDVDRVGAGAANGRRAVPAGIGDGNHLVAGPDPESPQRQFQRVGAVAGADAMRDSAKRRERLLEGAHLRAQNVPAAPQHRHEPAFDLRQKWAVMATQVVDEKPLSFLAVHSGKNGYYSLAATAGLFPPLRREVSEHVQHQVSWIAGERADASVGCGHDCQVRCDRPIQRIERRHRRLALPLRPQA